MRGEGERGTVMEEETSSRKLMREGEQRVTLERRICLILAFPLISPRVFKLQDQGWMLGRHEIQETRVIDMTAAKYVWKLTIVQTHMRKTEINAHVHIW